MNWGDLWSLSARWDQLAGIHPLLEATPASMFYAMKSDPPRMEITIATELLESGGWVAHADFGSVEATGATRDDAIRAARSAVYRLLADRSESDPTTDAAVVIHVFPWVTLPANLPEPEDWFDPDAGTPVRWVQGKGLVEQ